MKKRIALLLTALALTLSLTACTKPLPRDENGYITEDAAYKIAVSNTGYEAEDVSLAGKNFTGDGTGEDADAVYTFIFTDSVALYTVTVNALDGTVVSAEAE